MDTVKEHYITNLIKNSNLKDTEITKYLEQPHNYEYIVNKGLKHGFINTSKVRSKKLSDSLNQRYIGLDELIVSLEDHGEDKIRTITFFENIHFYYEGLEFEKLSDIHKTYPSIDRVKKFVFEMNYKIVAIRFNLFTDRYYLKILGALYYGENHKVKTEPLPEI